MAITLLQLRTQARQRADMNNTKFVTDAELNIYLNQSLSELYDLLVDLFNDRFVATQTFTIASGNTNALPEDFDKLLGVDYQISTNEWVEVKQGDFAQRNMSNTLPYWNYLRNYRVRGDNIEIYPASDALGTYRFQYVPRFQDLVDDTDTTSDLQHWEEYAVVDAAIKCLNKEESDVQVLMMQKQGLEKRIKASASRRNQAEPEKVVDKRAIRWGRGFRYGW